MLCRPNGERWHAMTSRALAHRVQYVIIVAVLVTAGCHSGTEPLRAVALSVMTQPPAAAQSGVVFTQAPVVQLLDRNGAPIAQADVGVTVTISAGIGALHGQTSVATDDQGRAVFNDLAIEALAGSFTLQFSSLGLTAASSASIGLTAGPASFVTAASQGPFVAVVNTPVATLPAVLVKDKSGNPVAGISVTFSAENGAGTVTGTNQLTNSSGIATVGSWILPKTVGQYFLDGTVAGFVPIRFEGDANHDAPSAIVRSGNNQSALYGRLLPQPLQAQVVDQYGNAVPLVNVVWQDLSSGTVLPISTATDQTGIAQANYQLGIVPGNNFARASINSFSITADFPETVLGFGKLAVGSDHTCALDDNGVAYCWGHNDSGQLGDSSTTDQDAPRPVAGGLRFANIVAGGSVTCALTSANVVYCWGSNAFGSIGDGTQTNRLVPTPVSGGLQFQQIATGGQLTCGLTTTGAAYCWGDNGAAQLGVGTTPVQTCTSALGNPDFSCSRLPVAVGGGLTFASITAGGPHACGLTAGGQLYCWGTSANFGSQNGLDSLPVLASGSLSFSEASAGSAHTCAVGGSTIYCWGNETQYGVIGDGAVNQTVTTPAQVLFRANYASAGFLGSCALGSDGGPTVGFCWGYNVEGGVGNGGTNPQTTPFSVFGNQTLTAIGTSGHHACAINVYRQVYCWGWNTWGQLGLGGGPDQYSETLVRP